MDTTAPPRLAHHVATATECVWLGFDDSYLPSQSRHKVLICLTATGVRQNGVFVLLSLCYVKHRDLVRLTAGGQKHNTWTSVWTSAKCKHADVQGLTTVWSRGFSAPSAASHSSSAGGSCSCQENTTHTWARYDHHHLQTSGHTPFLTVFNLFILIKPTENRMRKKVHVNTSMGTFNI